MFFPHNAIYPAVNIHTTFCSHSEMLFPAFFSKCNDSQAKQFTARLQKLSSLSLYASTNCICFFMLLVENYKATEQQFWSGVS